MECHDQPVFVSAQFQKQGTNQRSLRQGERLRHFLHCQIFGLSFAGHSPFPPGQRGIGTQGLGWPALVRGENGAEHRMALRQMLVGFCQHARFQWSPQFAKRRNVVRGGIRNQMIEKPKPLFGRGKFQGFALHQQIFLIITGLRGLPGTDCEGFNCLIRKQRRK